MCLTPYIRPNCVHRHVSNAHLPLQTGVEIIVGGTARRIAFYFLCLSARQPKQEHNDTLESVRAPWPLALVGSALFHRNRGGALPPPNPFGSI